MTFIKLFAVFLRDVAKCAAIFEVVKYFKIFLRIFMNFISFEYQKIISETKNYSLTE